MNEQKKRQDIILADREHLTITGVEDVTSFDEKSILLETRLGSLSVDGEGLHITALSVESGEIEVDGRIDGVLYFERTVGKKRGLFSKRAST